MLRKETDEGYKSSGNECSDDDEDYVPPGQQHSDEDIRSNEAESSKKIPALRSSSVEIKFEKPTKYVPVSNEEIEQMWNGFDKMTEDDTNKNPDTIISNISQRKIGKRRAENVASSSLAGLISSQSKKKKSTLDRSEGIWNDFIQQEGIEDDLKNHSKGKNSYLDRQNFLGRADYSQFEKEKELRQIKSKK